jgi:hypothetical protein
MNECGVNVLLVGWLGVTHHSSELAFVALPTSLLALASGALHSWCSWPLAAS